MENNKDNLIKELEKNYTHVQNYLKEKGLPYSTKALEMSMDIMDNGIRNENLQSRYRHEFLHSLEICIMLMDLHIPITKREEDILLAAAILHIYPEIINIDDLQHEIVDKMGFCREIYEITDIIKRQDYVTDGEQNEYYDRIQKNRLALLIALADRGNIIQKLYLYSTWNAHRYIDETKVCYYPMCIYGKEHYHDLLAPISVLKEKIKTLLEMEEILLHRYEVREAELIQDILNLREENATIKGIISKFST